MNKVKLGEIADFQTGPFGTQFSASEYVSAGVPVINVRNIGYGNIIEQDLEFVSEETKKRLHAHILKTSDIVFGRKGSVDRHAYIDERYSGWVQGSDCIRVRCTENINPHYLSHYLKLAHVKKQINSSAVGSTMASLNVDILKDIMVILPDIFEQNQIESILSVLEEKIEINSQICVELEAMAKTLYDYWFVQFDFPDENSKPYRTSGGEMVWNAQLKREIPKGWKAGTVGQLGDVVSGGTPTTTREDYYCNHGIAWITPNDLSKNEDKMFISHGERDITQSGLDNSSAVLMPKHSVLLSTRAPIGYLAISNNEICTNQGFKSIVPNAGYHEYFIYYLLKRNVSAIAQQGVGTTFKEVSKDTLSNFAVPLPSKILANNFAEKVTPLCEKRCVLEEENRELERARDWLLPMLMNGQARVK